MVGSKVLEMLDQGLKKFMVMMEGQKVEVFLAGLGHWRSELPSL